MKTVNPGGLSTKVELYLSCQKLINKDFISKSDPAVEVQMRFGISPNYSWKTIGITEMVKDKLSPVFNKTIVCDYRFEEQQPLRFFVYDIDQKHFSGKINRSMDELLGTCETSLGEICGAKGQVLKKPLQYQKKKNSGFIIIRAEEISKVSNDTVVLNAYGLKLKKMDVFGKSDPYYILKRRTRDGSYQQIYKSEIIKKTLNPKWKTLRISMSKLCRGDKNVKLRVEVYDWDKNSKDDMIGYSDFLVGELLASKQRDYTLRYDKKKNSRRGDIRFQVVQVIKNYSFFEYLTGGMEISLSCAIDFTGSNGNPNQPGTLHYHQQGYMNEYESATRSVGEILANYDSDKLFPVFGFGAQMPNGQVSHCFALNGNAENPECSGVNGMIQAYHQALTSVQLYGPTYFSEVLSVANTYAASANVCQDIQKYFILVIITDGIINDMEKTIDTIVGASYAPLSVVIVGVGNANFDAMDELDCDEGLLRTTGGKTAQRDIVQFVPFSKFKNLGYEALAKETLAEIPKQVVDYMKGKKIVPNKRPTVTFSAPAPQQMQRGQMQQQPQVVVPQQQQMQVNQGTQGVVQDTFNI